MPTKTYTHPKTLALHAGYRKDAATNAVAVPIYQTTATSSTTRLMPPTCSG
jgi:O-acetylhomoserine/O-acetylserine sulfhydrylase-like pyridoxal-dependent enzyme